MSRYPTWVLSTALIASLSGCGRGGEESATGAGGDESAASIEVAEGGGACDLVTQADASALFGQPASPGSGPSAVTMFDQCLWTWDTETSNQLLQFSIWDARAYAPPEDSRPLALGERGYFRAHPVAGVDIGWIQGGRMISLNYSTIGPDAPQAASRVDQMQALARLVQTRF